MKVPEYLLNYLHSLGIKHVFLLTGGACAFIVDAFHGRKDISYVCVQHEQAGAMAAEAYSRVGPGISAALVTSGPGATNLITGMACAWFDSIPVIYISGQVNMQESKGDSGVRQVGFQETDIVSMVKPITKYAVLVDDVKKLRYHLEKAVYLARSGRPGPVLIDIPMNVQKEDIDPATLEGFVPPVEQTYDQGEALAGKARHALELLARAKRPVLIAGGGIRLSGAVNEFRSLVDALRIPVVASWSGLDTLPHDHGSYVGQFGVYGSRAANFTVQNADLILSIGSRLDTRQTGGKPSTFGREAIKIMVDIDLPELNKRRGLTPDLPVHCDAKTFIAAMHKELHAAPLRHDISAWITQTAEWKLRYPACLPEWHQRTGSVNPYVFVDALSRAAAKDAVIIPDCGANLTWTIQGIHVRDGQRCFSAMGNSPMGYSFPATIGASIALGNKPVICIIGDGGFQINLQELQTVMHYKLPVKIFILNNHSYGIIKQFQDMYFDSRYEATGHGYSVPDFVKIAQAYGLHTVIIKNHGELASKLREVLDHPGPVLCDVILDDNEKIVPKLGWGKPIEDQTPYLERAEFARNMIVKPLNEGPDVSI